MDTQTDGQINGYRFSSDVRVIRLETYSIGETLNFTVNYGLNDTHIAFTVDFGGHIGPMVTHSAPTSGIRVPVLA